MSPRVRRSTTAIAIAAVLVTGVTLAAAPAIAQSTGTAFDDVIDTGDQGALDWAKAGWITVTSGLERTNYWIASKTPIGGVEQSADQELSTLADYYNAHNETLESDVNERASFDEGNHTIELSLHIQDTSATGYLEATVDASGNLTTSEIVSSTDRTITDRVALCDLAAEKSTEELERWHDEFAEPGANVTIEYLAELRGKYGKDVETTIVSSSGECPS